MKEFNEVMSVVEASKNFGFRSLENGTRTYGYIPHKGTHAWLHRVFPPLNSSEILELEYKLKKPLPDKFIEFLLQANGLNLFFNRLSIDGLRANYVRTIEAVAQQPFDIMTPNTFERPPDAKSEYFFVGGYGQDGSLLYIDSTTEKIYRCHCDSCKPLNEWNDFGTMLVSEVQRLALLFDEQGHQINPNEPTTP